MCQLGRGKNFQQTFLYFRIRKYENENISIFIFKFFFLVAGKRKHFLNCITRFVPFSEFEQDRFGRDAEQMSSSFCYIFLFIEISFKD